MATDKEWVSGSEIKGALRDAAQSLLRGDFDADRFAFPEGSLEGQSTTNVPSFSELRELIESRLRPPMYGGAFGGGAAPRDESLVEAIPATALQKLDTVSFVPVSDVLQLLTNPQLLYELSPRKFEEVVAEVLSGIGFQDVLLTPSSADGGIDVFATKEVNGIPIILGCECKRYAESRKIGLGTVRSLLGAIRQSDVQATIGVLVTTSTFTKGARKLIGTEATLDGKDFFGVVDWIKEYSKKTS